MNPTNELATIPPAQRAMLALGSDKARIDLAELVNKSKDVKEVNSQAGRDQAHNFYMGLVRARTTITKLAKEARDDATKFSKAVIAEEESLKSITEPEEKRLLALRDAWDAKVAAEKAEKEAAEKARKETIQGRIGEIRDYFGMAMDCRTAARIDVLRDKLASMILQEADYQEFLPEAMATLADTFARVDALLQTRIEAEAEAARIKAEQEEQAQQLAQEKARQEKAAAELARQRAEIEAEASRIKAQQEQAAAELERQRAEIEAERQRIKAEAEAKAELERIQTEAEQHAQQAQADRLAYEAAITQEEKAPAIPPGICKTSDTPFITYNPFPLVEANPPCCAADGVCTDACSGANDRPSDTEIVSVLAMHYRVHESKVLEWLIDMNLDAVGQSIESEFV